MTTVIEDITAERRLSHKHLVDDVTWERLVKRIVRDNDDIDRPLAEKIMNEALGFLYLAAIAPWERHSPSPKVDIGWHTFLQYTRAYAAFCEKYAGRFIHHEPFDEPGVEYGDLGGAVVATLDAMRRNHVNVDFPELWEESAACCDKSRYCCQPGNPPGKCG